MKAACCDFYLECVNDSVCAEAIGCEADLQCWSHVGLFSTPFITDYQKCANDCS